MAQTFAEMAAERDPLYAAMQPIGDMKTAVDLDRYYTESSGSLRTILTRDSLLFRLAVRALRNQGQPYYDR